MEQNIYSPANNLGCRYRFTCAAEKCQKVAVTSKPPCHIEKFSRYQPQNEVLWYQRDWEQVKRISWREVFSLQESWIYALLIIIITTFMFMSMILIYLYISNRY